MMAQPTTSAGKRFRDDLLDAWEGEYGDDPGHIGLGLDEDIVAIEHEARGDFETVVKALENLVWAWDQREGVLIAHRQARDVLELLT
jgi:hypothetical protein